MEVESYMGRIVAIDASMALYQFLIAIRAQGGEGTAAAVLTNAEGEQTSHIQGMFNRTIRLLSAGIKPVYVFDGKPPNMKGGELAKRQAKRAEAQKKLEEARAKGDIEAIEKHEGALVKVSKKDAEDVKVLLRAMGVPVVEAPCEAEAQCAELVRGGKAYAAGTEDMDVLTFAATRQLRKLTFSSSKKADQRIVEINHARLLNDIGLTNDQFVDLCILCGCDYTNRIDKVGPKTALKLIKQHGSIEAILKSMSTSPKEYDRVPDEWLDADTRSKRKAKRRAQALARLTNTENRVPLETTKPKEDNNAHHQDIDNKQQQDKNKIQPLAFAATTNEIPAFAPTTQSVNTSTAEATFAATTNEIPAFAPTTQSVNISTEIEATSAPTTTEIVQQPLMTEATENIIPMEVDEDEFIPVKTAELKESESTEIELEEQNDEDESKHVPEYIGARKLFKEHEIIPAKDIQLKWTKPDEAALRAFLIDKMGFAAERVDGAIKKLITAQGSLKQQRMDSFFKVLPKKVDGNVNKRPPPPASKKPAAAKKKKTR
uniref:Flap endonuclease 1 n=1 Tax=Aureoumbra lagunensis TaxID=44058 RepID=A0A7S3JRV7_9STRA